MERKALFRVALAVAGISAADFARSIKIAQPTLSLYFKGKVQSPRIDKEVDVFVSQNLKKLHHELDRIMA